MLSSADGKRSVKKIPVFFCYVYAGIECPWGIPGLLFPQRINIWVYHLVTNLLFWVYWETESCNLPHSLQIFWLKSKSCSWFSASITKIQEFLQCLSWACPFNECRDNSLAEVSLTLNESLNKQLEIFSLSLIKVWVRSGFGYLQIYICV